ncbi:sodium:calcium antiporter [Fulvivirga sp.]|uniref:sodium:calcium antiporter n=1 Tax=Fulvivirga sp. TaxID=1931237 RepID=UPI0032ED8CE1
MLIFIYLICSLLGLWLGTEVLIKGALKIASFYNFSHVFIGLTVLAIGSDLPELFVAIKASLISNQGLDTSGIIVGNALGSSIAQISVILGIAGMAGYLTLTKKQLMGEGLIMPLSIVLTFLVAYDGVISLTDGLILILAYLVYYISLLRLEKVTAHETKQKGRAWPYILYILAGGFLVIYASDLVVENAIILAESWGIRQTFIGIIIISLGTSLPELAVSLNAAIKGSAGLSVGNLIGSNIFDLWIPVGVASIIAPIQVNINYLIPDFIVLLAVSCLILIFFNKTKGLQKKEALGLIVFYIVYLGYKIVQNVG